MELSPQQDVYYIDIVSPIDYFIDTVTPSAIQLNKEKTMSIELDGPLYLGSNSLQQQVDQNTEDITELQSDVSSIEGDIGSLDNLATSDKSSLVNAINETLSVLDPTQTADYIKNSKGLESGEISDNASIYPWVEEMSHSTFDRSKFTIVGSPNITDDGIASGFSATSVIQPNYDFNNASTANSWEVYIKLKTGSSVSSNQNIFANTSSNYTNFRLLNGKLKMEIGGDSSSLFNLTGIASLHANTVYYVKFVFTGTKYQIWLSTDGITYTLDNDGNSTDKFVSQGTWCIGSSYNMSQFAYPFLGSIDLKQFSITVDGVEIFNGNRTGIDTIKPDDYTVVGTPTISADGVLSNVSLSNYLSKTLSLTYTNTCEIITAIKTGSDISGRQRITNGAVNVQIGLVYTNYVTVQCDTVNNQNAISRSMEVKANTNYLFKVIDDGTNYSVWYKEEDDDWLQIGTSASKTDNINLSGEFDIGISGTVDNPFLGSIDLNAFKIYVDDDLVYQPCLKIPYTKSKTGSKIVSSIYRDRVEDMYQQFGYAPYYTLDTENENYTIPKGEVYGMVNKLVPTLVAPDYSKPVSLTYSSGLVMENDGWLEVQIQSSEATANPYVSINGSIICRTSVNSNGDLNRDTAMMVVRKGDVITSGGYSADTAIVLTYYPFKV